MSDPPLRATAATATAFDRLLRSTLPLFFTFITDPQLTEYKEGQYYRPHLDYEYKHDYNEQPCGQRVVSFQLCLNDDFQGGTEVFIDGWSVRVKPATGSLLVWENAHEDSCGAPNQQAVMNPRARHEVCDVTVGVKYCLNGWIREKPLLPQNKCAFDVAGSTILKSDLDRNLPDRNDSVVLRYSPPPPPVLNSTIASREKELAKMKPRKATDDTTKTRAPPIFTKATQHTLILPHMLEKDIGRITQLLEPSRCHHRGQAASQRYKSAAHADVYRQRRI